MPNPTGVNSFQPYAPEPAYGEKLQQEKLQQAAPLPANPPLNAPRRAQKKAVRGGRAAPQGQVAAPQMPPPQVNPALTVAQNWQAIAATPGASPLVQRIAQEAQSG